MNDIKPMTVGEQATALKATYDRLRDKTDGCTMSPDMNFMECCVVHDLRYRYNEENITRAQTDKELRECIAKKGHRLSSWFYWIAVRLCGRKQWKKEYAKPIA